MDLKGTRTEQNLIDAFMNEAQCSAIYDYAGRRASVEGHNDISAKLETSAKIRSNQARGNLQILQKNPLTGLSNTVTRLNLQSVISTATQNYHDKYSKMAEIARDEGFDGIADWFDTLAKAERMEAKLYEDALKTLLD